ncbi:Dolichyl-diphosphooligosaccharide-protein glycosyltransferase subunit dad1 [Stygiomarasmius scandens]|uniref:DASH complex subunit DAD1 n=1 Tax=Marasmiellus scandens TaxID=2682957 RepID=A0ABR1K4Z3_9AGAR
MMLSQSQTDEEKPFFERERERLTREITSGFEDLLSTSNSLNRKLEEVLGMTREYDTIAALWQSFYELMRQSGTEEGDITIEESAPGLPGTGGHVVK